METITSKPELYFDPFAAEGEEMYDPLATHDVLTERYKNNEIEHDYSADKFVADTEALMMDAHFNEQFSEMAVIAARMHVLCGEDHNLQQQMGASEIFSEYSSPDGHKKHNHSHDTYKKQGHKKEAKKKEDSKKKKRKKIKQLSGWALLDITQKSAG